MAEKAAWVALQRKNLDAALAFLAARHRYLAALDTRGRPLLSGVEVVGIGMLQVRRSLSTRWARELLSVRSRTDRRYVGI